MPKLILASKSPRRRELLDRMGLPHTVVSAPCDEWFPEDLSPAEIVKYISREKAFAAAEMAAPEDILITADTMVFLDDKKLGKPKDEAEAFAMLRALSGRTHTVYTGVTVAQGHRTLTLLLADADGLHHYIKTGEPMDKAGAYGVQALGALLIEGIEGDFFNVMGLPVRRLALMLEKFGVSVLS